MSVEAIFHDPLWPLTGAWESRRSGSLPNIASLQKYISFKATRSVTPQTSGGEYLNMTYISRFLHYLEQDQHELKIFLHSWSCRTHRSCHPNGLKNGEGTVAVSFCSPFSNCRNQFLLNISISIKDRKSN